MALPPQTQGSSIEDSFLADRTAFWTSFTGFSKYAIIAVVVLLILMWIFLV